mgnify:CR=1 FL=1
MPEKIFMQPNSLIEVDFLNEIRSEMHSHENFELLYVMSGKFELQIEQEKFTLTVNDFIIVNTNLRHSWKMTQGSIIGRLCIQYSAVKRLLNKNIILFWCNSTLEPADDYKDLRDTIIKIFGEHVRESGEDKIYLNCLYYKLLSILTGNFLLTDKNAKYADKRADSSERLQKIYEYFHLNYKNSISLKQVADCLFLSPTYLSKFIKKASGMNFVDLLNSVRLNHAMEDILFSDASIIKIAMENGFASVAAFNRVFKDVYKMTPSTFRREKKNKRRNAKEKNQSDYKQSVRRFMSNYFVEDKLTDNHGGQIHSEIVFDLNILTPQSWQNTCATMINAGRAVELTQSLCQENILRMKRELGIQYVRFWDIYAPEMQLDINAPAQSVHFTKLDEVLDFLIKNNLKPYIELGFKPVKILKNADKALFEIRRDQTFDSDTQMEKFFERFIRHLIKRYESEEILTWYFEYWRRENLDFRDLAFHFQPITAQDEQKYFREFDILAGALRKYLPKIRIGGAGFPIQHYGSRGFEDMLKSWLKYKELPSFVSLNSYPYQIHCEGGTYFEKRKTDIHFVLHDIETAYNSIAATNFPVNEVHVSEYALTLSNRNAINDSCRHGAYLLMNALECTGRANVVGYWLASDAYANFKDTNEFLFGGCGLVTKSGVAKPGFYALHFLHRQYKYILAKEKNYILTTDGVGHYKILCHNHKSMNAKYFLTPEDKILAGDIPLMLEDNENLIMHVTIKGVIDGKWKIKQIQTNGLFGSIQDEWLRLGMESCLNIKDLEYLNRICTPRLSIINLESRDNILSFEIKLLPNEIQYLSIYPV